MATNGRSGNKVGTKGMMPDASIGGQVVSQIFNKTGVKKQLIKTAATVTAPLGLLTLCMLPSIVKALSAITGIATFVAILYFGFRILNARKGQSETGSETEGRFGKSFDFITQEELEARKARAYAPKGRAEARETITTR